jgi:membrane-bound lytic murein transglycosylase B
VPRRKASGKKAAPKTAAPAKKLAPLKSLTPDYARRLKRAAKQQGITVTQLRRQGAGAARGHKVPPGQREAQVRRQRLDARLQAIAMEQAMKWKGVDAGKVAAEIAAALHRMVAKHGMERLRQVQAEIASMHANYIAQPGRDQKGRRPTLGIDLEELEDEYELPREMFAYH